MLYRAVGLKILMIAKSYYENNFFATKPVFLFCVFFSNFINQNGAKRNYNQRNFIENLYQ
jgi:hypothetical protein